MERADRQGWPDASGFTRRGILGTILAGGAIAGPSPAIASEYPRLAIRSGAVHVRGRDMRWRAETGEAPVRSGNGQPKATIFSVAYLAEGFDPSRRPVTFLWNGGPGGATWPLREHLSPRITVATPTRPGYAFADNPNSLIDVSDLVFIDAPGTGFSRILYPAAKSELWGVEADGLAFAAFIADWLSTHGRTRSPLFIVAESYGGTRAGQVVRNLDEAAIAVRGITLVSPTLSPLGGRQNWYRSYSPAITLPAMAATAWYQRRGAHLRQSLDALLADALAFSRGPYRDALAHPNGLTSADAAGIADQVSGYIGLPVDAVVREGLVVPLPKYIAALLADKGLVLEAGDGRQTRPVAKPDSAAAVLSLDEGFDRTASIEALIRTDLGYPGVGAYARDPREISKSWKQDTDRDADADTIFAAQMRRDPRLRVYMVGGCFDMIVPYPASLTRLRHALSPERFASRIYHTGHAVFEDPALRYRTTGDLSRFYQGTRV